MDPQYFLNELPYLRRVARKLLSDPSAADDLVQDAWLQYRRRPPEQGRSLRPWLTGVLRNLSLQRRRSEARRVAREQSAPGDRDRLPRAPESQLSERETALLLAREIAQLGEPYQRVLRQHYFDELTTLQIAEQAGLAHSTVRTHLRRGLQGLRESLDRRGGKQDWVPSLLLLAGVGSAPSLQRQVSSLPRVVGGAGLAAAVVVTAAWLGLRDPGRNAAPALSPSGLAGSTARRAGPAGVPPERRTGVTTVPETVRLDVDVRYELSGEPVPGAEVSALLDGRTLSTVEADDAGRVQLTLPRDRSFELTVAPTPTSSGVERPMSPLRFDESIKVGVRELCVVRGRVVRSSPGPLAGHRVQAIDGPYPSLLDGSEPVVHAETHTRSDGSFELNSVPVDSGLLATSMDGLLHGLYGARVVRESSRVDWRPVRPRSRGELLDAEQDIRIRLVESASLSLRVFDPSGNPYPGAELSLIGAGFTERRFVTGDDGRAVQDWLLHKRALALGVTAPGHAGQVHDWISVYRDRPEYEVHLQLERPIHGRVEDRLGRPIPGAIVRATVQASTRGSGANSEPRAESEPLPERLYERVFPGAVSDSDGNFVLRGLGDDDYLLEASQAGHILGKAQARGGDTSVVLRYSPPAVRVTGRVVDADTGLAISNALLCAEPIQDGGRRGRPRAATINGNRFEIPVDADRPWVIFAEAAGYTLFSTLPRAFRAGEHELTVRLARQRQVEYRVVDAHGTPGVGLWVVAVRTRLEQGWGGITSSTDHRGVVVLDVPAIEHVVSVWAPNFVKPFEFRVAPEEQSPVLRLPCSWTEERRDHLWELVRADTSERLFLKTLPRFDLAVFDVDGTPVMGVRWEPAAAGHDRLALSNIRRPVRDQTSELRVVGTNTPSPWWWLGNGPLFTAAGVDVLPPLPMPISELRFVLTAPGYEPLKRTIDMATRAPDSLLRFDLVPLTDEEL